MRIQIVCPHPRLGRILERLVANVASEVTVSRSAPEALEAYKESLADGRTPAFLIVDDALKGQDAGWLGREIRRIAAPPPVLLLLRSLGSAQPNVAEELFDRTISKPVKVALLYRALQELTGGPARDPVATPAIHTHAGRALNIRVLIADDNAVNQLVARRMLQKLGATVQCVDNGLLALRALEADAYDVVLMDCQMPEMDGYEATRRLRAEPARYKNSTVPVIALTANAFATDRDQCIAAGMNDFLSKPLDLVRLEECLNRTVFGDYARGQRLQAG